MNYKKALIILTIVLFFTSSFYLIIKGQTYTFEYKLTKKIDGIEDTELKGNVKISKKRFLFWEVSHKKIEFFKKERD